MAGVTSAIADSKINSAFFDSLGTSSSAASAGSSFGVSDAMIGCSIASGAADITTAIVGVIDGCNTAEFQNAMIEIKEQSALNALNHQDTMAFKTQQLQLSQIKHQEKNQQITEEMQGLQIEASEERKKAEDGERIVDAEIAEAKLTKKQGQINNGLLLQFCDKRGKYTNSGKPSKV